MSKIRGTVEAKRTTRWIKTAGIGTIIGSGAVLAAAVIDNVTKITDATATAGSVTTWAMFTIGAFLLLIGAMAVYARYGEEYGSLGNVGTAIAGLGFFWMLVGGVWSAIDTSPTLEASTVNRFAFIGLLIAVLGSVILGIALRPTGVANRAATLLIAAPVVLVSIFVVSETISAVVSVDVLWLLLLLTFCAGWIALGDALRHSPESPVERAATPVD